MVKGFIIAVLLHGMVFALVAFSGPGLFHSGFDSPEPTTVSARLVTIDDLNRKKKPKEPPQNDLTKPKKEKVKQSRRTVPEQTLAPLIEKREPEKEEPEKSEPVQEDEPEKAAEEAGDSEEETVTEYTYLRNKVTKCFVDPNPTGTGKREAKLLLKFNREGYLVGPPQVLLATDSVLAERAQRAVLKCQPYKRLGSNSNYRDGFHFTFRP